MLSILKNRTFLLFFIGNVSPRGATILSRPWTERPVASATFKISGGFEIGIAGIANSEHLIAICDAAPPNFVIKPLIFFEKIQSNPGSAFSNNTILLKILSYSSGASDSASINSDVIFLLVIKLGLAERNSTNSRSFFSKIKDGNFT